MLNLKGLWPIAASGIVALIAACGSAGGGPVEESATTVAAVGEQEKGFKCSAASVAMPTDLPDVEACINDEAGGTGPATGCNGWSKKGPYANTSAELRSAENLGAQLYTIEPDSSTICLYLYRGDRKTTQGSLNGVHCYNKTTCDVCWWDAATKANTKPTADDLRHASTDDCASCHRNGPVLPKYTLWEAVSDETAALHQVCAKAGGPTWAQAPQAWRNRSPDKTSIVKQPQGCGGNDCHKNGFASGGEYCQQIKHAFEPNGSMRELGEKFGSKTGCENFRSAMGCQAADIDCDNTDIANAAAAAGGGTTSSSSSGGDAPEDFGDEPLPPEEG